MGKARQPSAPDPMAISNIQGQLNSQALIDAAAINRPQQESPFGYTHWGSDPSGKYWTQYYQPDQRIVDNFYKQLGIENSMMDLASFMKDNIYSTIRSPNGTYRAFDPTDIPGMVATVPNNDVIGEIDLSGVSDIPGLDDYSADRQRVEDAMYGRQTSRLDPEWSGRQARLESDLANQGFARGSEGWNNAVSDFERQREAAYSGARNDAIVGGGAEQSRMFADALAGRQQGVGEQFQKGTFYNTAAGQDFGQRFQSGQYQNAARSQRFGEELAKRNQVLSEFSQLMGMSGPPQLPQFQTPAQIQGPGAPDYTSAALGAANAAQSGANARNASKGAGLGGAASIAAAFV